MELTITRAEYMARPKSKESFQEYYGQFDTPAVRRMVLTVARIETLVAAYAQDPHLNTIGLKIWDSAAQWLPQDVVSLLGKSNASTTSGGLRVVSHSDKVCVLKAAAVNMVKEYNSHGQE